jgi:hypothetical protein
MNIHILIHIRRYRQMYIDIPVPIIKSGIIRKFLFLLLLLYVYMLFLIFNSGFFISVNIVFNVEQNKNFLLRSYLKAFENVN